MNSCTSLDSRYILFLGMNPSFNSIVWFHTFFVGILSLTFFLKIWIYLWDIRETNFLASSSDFAAFSSLFQISYSSVTFFTFIVCFFFSFFFLFYFFFLFSFSFYFFPSSFLFSFSFCFCYSNFTCFSLYCLLYFSEHLVIFTFSVLQSISGLW